MIKQLKQILMNVARLPSSDQRWVVRQLTAQQLTQLKQAEGLKLLHEAQRFRTLKPNQFETPPEPLPVCCTILATKAPLYAAIVLDQSSSPWKSEFLKQFDQEGTIKSLLTNQVLDIKPLVKQALLKEWENSLSFDMHLSEEA